MLKRATDPQKPVPELGLRRLAKGLRVKISNNGKNCPLEYGDWNTVITAIRNKIAETRRLPTGKKKESLLQFYSTAADHCEYMKDIWRNELSHTRRRYSKPESLAVLNRVKEFVQPLAQIDAKKVINKRIRLKQRQQSYAPVKAGSLVSLSAIVKGHSTVKGKLDAK